MQDRDKLEADITMEEIGKAVLKLPNNKVSRCDGIPIDWYKCFWHKIKYLITDMIQESVSDQQLHLTAR